jgi:DNA repair photolyase
MPDRNQPRAGRGAASNPASRFEATESVAVDDGWGLLEEPLPALETVVTAEAARTIIARNTSPDIPFSQSINPYRGCEHGCVYCLEGDTPILYADGCHRPIKDAKVGDLIIGTVRNGRYRSYVETTISNHWTTLKPAYRITLADGTELISSRDHRFLTERGWKFVIGSGSGRDCRPHLTLGNRLLGTGAFAERPEECVDYRRGYLCGLIEGDGHTGSYSCTRRGDMQSAQHVLRLASIDFQALRRARRYLRTFSVQTYDFEFPKAIGASRMSRAIRTDAPQQVEAIRALIRRPETRSQSWHKGFLAGIFDAEGHRQAKGPIRISNADASMIGEVTSALDRFGFTYCLERVEHSDCRPVIVVRIKGGLVQKLRFFHLTDPAIGRKCSIAGIRLKPGADLRVMAIEPLGKAVRMYDITTGTGDFIANGVVSHNCYARPSHAYAGLSPGLDFETRLFYKRDAAALLKKELAAKSYRCSPISLGANTDPYQPIERRYGVTRSILEVLSGCNHPATIVTKGAALIRRDIDLLASMAERRLVAVFVSITTLDPALKRTLEPRAASPAARLSVVRELGRAGVPVGVMVAPVIPVLTDHQAERILEAAAAAGAKAAGYVMLRLPHEVSKLFREWLETHEPLKAAHVMSRLKALREGRDNDPRFGARMRGTGEYAALFRRRFELAKRRFALDRNADLFELDTGRFAPPARESRQQGLF